MSLFVAVRPSDEAVEDLQHAVARVRRLSPGQELRWQPPGQWHVTLAFLGDDSDDVVPAVCERLERLSTASAVGGLRIAGAGCFGRQVLWMDLQDADAVAGLGALAHAIPPLLRGSGARPDRRPWRPHLTVARARHTDARTVVPMLVDYSGPVWSAQDLLVIRSTGGPHPEHHVAMRIRLVGDPT